MARTAPKDAGIATEVGVEGTELVAGNKMPPAGSTESPVSVAPIAPKAGATEEGGATFLAVIASAARDPAVNVEKMAALLDMQERVVAKRAEAEFNQALARLMKVLPRVKKNGVVEYPEDKNKPQGPKAKAFNFARWEDIDAAIRPLLDAEGFSLSFNSAPRTGDGGGIVVTGTLLHGGGHSRSASIPLALDASGGKNNLQAMGSTFSYGKRYTTTALLNLVFEGEDDDGVRGGMVFASPDQVAQIEALITETKTDRDAFLDYMEAGSVEGIQAKHVPKALNALATKRRKMAEAKAPAP